MARGTYRGHREPKPDVWRIQIVLRDVPVEPHPESKRVDLDDVEQPPEPEAE